MKTIKLKAALLFAATAFFISGCDGSSSDNSNADEINEILDNLNYLEQDDPTEEPVEIADEGTEEDGNYSCSVKRMKASVEYSEMFCLDPQTDIIWPGSLLDGNTILNGKYTPINLKRGPLTISCSIPFTSGSKSASVDEAKLSTVRNAIAEILDSEVTGSTPAKLNFYTESVHESNDLNLAVGFNYKSPTINVDAMFNFSNSNVKQRVIAKFVQVYYSIDMDLPTSPDELLADSVTAGDFNKAISGDVSPMYVSSVQYGRMALFSFESSSRATDLKAAVDASYNSVSGSLDVEYEEILKNSTIKIMILGGDGSSAAESVDGYDAFLEYIKAGGNFDNDSPGVPLAYKLRYMTDNSIGNIIMTSEYSVRNCEKIQGSYKVSLTSLNGGISQDDGTNSTLEIFGHIMVSPIIYGDGASVDPAGTVILLQRDDSNAIEVAENSIVSITGDTTFAFNKPDTAKSGFTITATLYEDDGGTIFDPNDNLGTVAKTIYLSEVQSYQPITLTGFSSGFGGVTFQIQSIE